MLWLVLVPTQVAFVYVRLHQLARASPELKLQVGQFGGTVRRDKLLPFALELVGLREFSTITAINAPGMLGEFLVSVPTSWPDSWHPSNLSLFGWRCVTLPFFCIPAWWFAGRGLDAILGWRHPRWWTLLIGTLLCCGFLILLLGFRFGMSFEDRAGTAWILWGCGLWALMFAPFPALWIRRAFARQPSPSSD